MVKETLRMHPPGPSYHGPGYPRRTSNSQQWQGGARQHHRHGQRVGGPPSVQAGGFLTSSGGVDIDGFGQAGQGRAALACCPRSPPARRSPKSRFSRFLQNRPKS
ncbi:hypothetical protein CRG98_022504 [Punica granatum]|uniref:Uncharacterized protein n=1 Tax=Punica granatum TaxID=22663 RepID=A0A2I0JMI0_PUNGR|nr:hypothetical protein CRG98_022504 [Punica granatum]